MKKLVLIGLAVLFAVGMFITAPAMAQHPSDNLCRQIGNTQDIECEAIVMQKINGFQVGVSTPHAATKLNGWFCNGADLVTPATLAETTYEYRNGKYVAKNMVGVRHHPVLRPADPNNGDCSIVNWSKLEELPGMRMKEGIVPRFIDQSEGWNKPCICIGTPCAKYRN